MKTTVKSNLSGVNPDLQREREKASFSIEEFQQWWAGGADKLKDKREVERILFEDEPINNYYQSYLSYKDLYNDALKRAVKYAEKLKKLQKERDPEGNQIWPTRFFHSSSHGILPHMSPFTAHFTMFIDAIRNQGTDEQFEKIGKLAEKFVIVGTYAQTELGHGTNIRGLQTRADYDRKSDEFILNTPCLEAYKWWPAGLGHSTNHALVVAQLYIDGVHHGLQMFVVPIRHIETHKPLPGVHVGDIGKKLGMAAVNQGFLGLTNVRIPRFNMLMRNSKVLPDGSFVKSPISKLTYLTMVYTRCLLVLQNAIYLLEAVVIATRYSVVRRQSHINDREPEVQVMDHVTQQYKVLPQIAIGMAYYTVLEHMFEEYNQTLKEIELGNYNRLPAMHILSSVLKVLCTSDSAVGVERLRMACGGHGYMEAANFGILYNNCVAACTYEGENTVLLLQVGRYLIKNWNKLINGQQAPTDLNYFIEFISYDNPPKWSGKWDNIVKAMQYTAVNKTRVAFEKFSNRLAQGQTMGEAANSTGIEIIQAAEFHGRQFVAATFLEQITGPKSAQRSPNLNRVLENVLELFLVQTVLNNLSDILRFVNLTNADVISLQNRLETVLQKLRPDAVAICDGFDYHDSVLNSVLGCYDGNVYKRLFDSAQQSTLNEQPVQDSFDTYLKPFLKSNM